MLPALPLLRFDDVGWTRARRAAPRSRDSSYRSMFPDACRIFFPCLRRARRAPPRRPSPHAKWMPPSQTRLPAFQTVGSSWKSRAHFGVSCPSPARQERRHRFLPVPAVTAIGFSDDARQGRRDSRGGTARPASSMTRFRTAPGPPASKRAAAVPDVSRWRPGGIAWSASMKRWRKPPERRRVARCPASSP